MRASWSSGCAREKAGSASVFWEILGRPRFCRATALDGGARSSPSGDAKIAVIFPRSLNPAYWTDLVGSTRATSSSSRTQVHGAVSCLTSSPVTTSTALRMSKFQKSLASEAPSQYVPFRL